MIRLLSFFTFAEASGGGGFHTPWMNFPSDHQVAEYWIDCKTHREGTVDLTLESSIDGVAVQIVSGPTSINAAGLTRVEITDKLGPLVRLHLQQNGGNAIATFCAWLVPKIGG